MMSHYYNHLLQDAAKQVADNKKALFERNENAKILDLGVNDGVELLLWASHIGSKQLYGVDIQRARLIQASEKGIKCTWADLNNPLPFESGTFDIVYSSCVIEHLLNLDLFVQEIHRILKLGGYAIIHTENLSSWHNIFALILGFQAFAQIISRKIYGIGNPLSPLYKKEIELESWAHIHILTYSGIKELFQVYGFRAEKIVGGGYYPFWGFISKLFSKLDPRHSAYITIKVRKSNNGASV